LDRPKVRGTAQRFASQLLGAHVDRPDQRARGVGHRRVRPRPLDRDFEATLAEALGAQAALSRSTVGRICAQLAEEFTA
jgi:hypothetical protein